MTTNVTLVKIGKNATLEIKGGSDYMINGGRGGIGGIGGKNGQCIKDPNTCKNAGSGNSGSSNQPPLHVTNALSNNMDGLQGISQESIHLP